MTLIACHGFETGNTLLCATTAGTFEIQSDVVNTGAFALRTNPTTTSSGAAFLGKVNTTTAAWTGFSGTPLDIADAYISFWFRCDTAPASGSEPICQVMTGSFSTKLTVRMNADRTLAVYDATGSLVATGTTAIELEAWYRISVRCSVDAESGGPYALEINGESELSGSATQGSANVGLVVLGKTNNVGGNSVDFYYDDYAVADDAFLAAAAVYPIQVTGAGSFSQWSTSSGDGPGDVDEPAPHDGDTSYIHSTTSGHVSLFAMTNAGDAGIDAAASILALQAIAVVRDEANGGESVAVRLRAGLNTQTSASVDPGSTYVAKGFLSRVNPDTSAAWTVSGIDNVQIGVVNGLDAQVRCTWILGEVLATRDEGAPPEPEVTSNVGRPTNARLPASGSRPSSARLRP